VSYQQIPVEQPKESKPFAPMLVTVSVFLLTLVYIYLKPHKNDMMCGRTVLPLFLNFYECLKLRKKDEMCG